MAVVRPKVILASNPGTATFLVNGDGRAWNLELLDDSDSDSDGSGGGTACGGPRKRKRLTHLSPEEKMMRRKLKNRVAAQTARDRKKQKMTELEETLLIMQAENHKLLAENAKLKHCTSQLSKENNILKKRLGTSDNTMVEEMKVEIKDEPTDVVNTGRLHESVLESAVLSVPRQQDSTRAIISLTTTQLLAFLVLVVALTHLTMTPSRVSQRQPTSMPMINPGQVITIQPDSSLDPELPPWWGSHQRNWNPSMNS